MELEHHEQLLSLGWDADKQEGINQIVLRHQNKIEFIHGDNIAFLRWCKENQLWKYFHVGIVDPPYGISVGDMRLGATIASEAKNPRKYEMGSWDGAVPTAEYWELLRYCCRELIVWGGNYFTKEFDWSGRGFYVWNKKNNGMSFADCELALTTMDFSARIIPKSRSLSESEGDKRHPTHKPAYLYEYLHLQHDLRGKKVLDTHGGSFSHAQAAFRESVKLTIMDRERSYFDSGLEAFDAKVNSSPTGFLF